MTIVISVGMPQFLVMACDSAVVKEFDDGHREYDTGRKWWWKAGIGVVTMWGARDGNALRSYLDRLAIDPTRQTVEDLALAVHQYLVSDYRPGDNGISDTGYHIGGFDKQGRPRLYHAFWNVAGSPAAFDSHGAYALQDQSPTTRVGRFLYNGRNDFADKVISSLLFEIRRGAPVKFGRTAPEIGRLCHFVLRFGSEISPEIAMPFFLHFLAPQGGIECIKIDIMSPLPIGHFDEVWARASVAG